MALIAIAPATYGPVFVPYGVAIVATVVHTDADKSLVTTVEADSIIISQEP